MSTDFRHHSQLAKALRVEYKDNLKLLMVLKERHAAMWTDHATELADHNLVKHTVQGIFLRVIRQAEAEEAREVEVRCLLLILSTSSDGHTLAETVPAGHMSAS